MGIRSLSASSITAASLSPSLRQEEAARCRPRGTPSIGAPRRAGFERAARASRAGDPCARGPSARCGAGGGRGGAWPPRLLGSLHPSAENSAPRLPGSLHPPAENGLPVPTRRRAGEAASRSPAVRSRSAVVVDFLMTRNDGSRHKAVLLAPKSNRCCFNCSYKKDK